MLNGAISTLLTKLNRSFVPAAERNRREPPKQVALAIAAHEYSYQRRKIRGIIDYYQKHCTWDILRNEQGQPFTTYSTLSKGSCDGVIGELYDDSDVELVNKLSVPFVNTSSSTLVPDAPTVCVDNHAIGRMAAEHLLELELDHFAFIGPTGLGHSEIRRQGFEKELRMSDASCAVVEVDVHDPERRAVSAEAVDPVDLKQSVADLKKPVGVMASSDRVGFAVLEACRLLGLNSPEDVALVSVDNDEIYTHLAYASMTSIEPSAREVGFQAAAMLDDLMTGRSLEESDVLVPPLRLVKRDSTDRTRSNYPEVARALRFIRNHTSEYIDVTDVLNVVPASRRWLEVKFKEEVGHGIYQEILRVHVERARDLIETTDWPVSRIAEASGFTSTERLDFAFKRLLGVTVAEYQKAGG